MKIPHFIIGGAPRSGTTFLCHFLDVHPDIFIAKPFIPEPKVFMSSCEEGRLGYIKRYTPLFADANPNQVLGEKTSYYLENKESFVRITNTFSEMKFIFLVREPVERAYSNYLWSLKNGLESLSFENAIKMEGERQNPLPENLSYARPFDYLSRGDYANFARRYIEAYGPENVQFFLYENLYLSPKSLLNNIQKFIGVSPMRSDVSLEPVNVRNKNAPKLDPDLACRLKEKMRPLVEDFANYANIDIDPWNY